jgi:hypothetical protein
VEAALNRVENSSAHETMRGLTNWVFAECNGTAAIPLTADIPRRHVLLLVAYSQVYDFVIQNAGDFHVTHAEFHRRLPLLRAEIALYSFAHDFAPAIPQHVLSGIGLFARTVVPPTFELAWIVFTFTGQIILWVLGHFFRALEIIFRPAIETIEENAAGFLAIPAAFLIVLITCGFPTSVRFVACFVSVLTNPIVARLIGTGFALWVVVFVLLVRLPELIHEAQQRARRVPVVTAPTPRYNGNGFGPRTIEDFREQSAFGDGQLARRQQIAEALPSDAARRSAC